MKGIAMALDVGTRRIGVAVSDRDQRMALPVETVDAKPQAEAVQRIAELIDDYDVTQLVVGWPLEMSGREGRAVDRVRELVERLERRLRGKNEDTITIHRWDERLTTTAADRLLVEADVSRARRRDAVDQIAACKILEGFIQRQRGE